MEVFGLEKKYEEWSINVKSNILISVIVPVYNTDKYLEECIKSLLLQTIPFYEIILINDGSTDDSGQICKEYSEQFKNIQLIEQENQGQSAARNRGLSIATGEYVVFVDSDDFVSNNMSECLKQNLLRNRVEVLYYSATIQNDLGIVQDNNAYVRKKEVCNCVMSGKDFFMKTYPDNYIVSPCTAIYKRDFLLKENIMFPKGILYEDNPFYLNVTMHSNRVLCIPDELYIRRLRANSTMTSKMSRRKCEDFITIQILLWDLIKRNKNFFTQEVIKKNYILDYVMLMLNMMYECKETLTQQSIDFSELFVHYWDHLFCSNDLSWNEACALMCFRKVWLDNVLKSEKKYTEFFEQVEKQLKKQLLYKLNKLPLKESEKVGIYGIGKHTKALMSVYKKVIGDITSEIYYIVSEKKEEIYMNKKVLDYREIPHDMSAIVISSKIYQEEILEILKKNQIDFCEIISIYSNTDKYDLTLVDELI